ncbi:MAG: helix-turn-helix domain-containing protein [Sphaerobacter sp.]|nr:helix-turn-helix domain-containing protein [Sphaerobacter sp.]
MARVQHDSSKVYTVGEAAELLQFHPDAIRYWLRVGELAGERVGTPEGWLIRSDALVAFLRQNGEPLPAALADAETVMPAAQLASQAA